MLCCVVNYPSREKLLERAKEVLTAERIAIERILEFNECVVPYRFYTNAGVIDLYVLIVKVTANTAYVTEYRLINHDTGDELYFDL